MNTSDEDMNTSDGNMNTSDKEMNSSDEEMTIDKGGLPLRPGVLLTQHEYLLAVSAGIIAFIAIFGSLQMISKLAKKRKKCGIQFAIYMSILIGNALMAALTIPMSIYLILAYRVPRSKDPSAFSEKDPQKPAFVESVLCGISGYVYNVTRSTTLWSVCFFTFDRLLFVCFPFKAKTRVRYWHYLLVIIIIWTYFIAMSASPFMFGKSYRRLDFDGLTCSFMIQDVMPDSLMDSNGRFPLGVMAPYLVTLVYIPQLLPLVLITCFTVTVIIELFKINRKRIKSQKVHVKQKGSAGAKRRKWYTVALVYMERNREVKLSVIMLLTSIGFLICYGLWIFFMLLHLGMFMSLIELSLLYSKDEAGNLYSKLFLIHEMVGFAHAAIEPMILYIILVKPKTATDRILSGTTTNHDLLRCIKQTYNGAKTTPSASAKYPGTRSSTVTQLKSSALQ